MKPASSVRLRVSLSVAGGLAITLLSIWLLATLNHFAIADIPPREHARIVMIQGRQNQSVEREQPENELEPDEYEPELVAVDFEIQTEPMDPELFEFDMVMPTPTVIPVEVAIQKRPTPETAVRLNRQPKSKPETKLASQVDQQPREQRSNPTPPYPDDKLANGVEGSVLVKILINESGRVEDAEVVSGDPDFARSVMSVVYKYRFTPARDRGRVVRVWGLKRFNFTIK